MVCPVGRRPSCCHDSSLRPAVAADVPAAGTPHTVGVPYPSGSTRLRCRGPVVLVHRKGTHRALPSSALVRHKGLLSSLAAQKRDAATACVERGTSKGSGPSGSTQPVSPPPDGVGCGLRQVCVVNSPGSSAPKRRPPGKCMADHEDTAGDEVSRLVELDTDESRAGVIYDPGPSFPVVGIPFVPAELLAEEPQPARLPPTPWPNALANRPSGMALQLSDQPCSRVPRRPASRNLRRQLRCKSARSGP